MRRLKFRSHNFFYFDYNIKKKIGVGLLHNAALWQKVRAK